MIGCVLYSAVMTFLPVLANPTPDSKFDPGSEIQIAVELVEKYHVSKQRLDEKLAQRWLERFLSELDPQHAYFLAKDHQEFRAQTAQMTAEARNGGFSFPQSVRKRYRERVRTATHYAQGWLKQKQDFDVDEDFTLQHDRYASDTTALKERWRLRIKAELLSEKLHGVAAADAVSQLSGRYRRIEIQARSLSDERLCELYLQSFAQVFDSGSIYLSPATLRLFRQTITPKQYSIGLQWRKIRGYFRLVGVDPRRGSPMDLVELRGWNLLAVRRIDGNLIDLVETNDIRFLYHPSDLLSHDNEIILELQHPVTLKRQSLLWQRL